MGLDKMEQGAGGGVGGVKHFHIFSPLLQPFSLFLSLYQPKKKFEDIIYAMMYIGFLLPDIYN